MCHMQTPTPGHSSTREDAHHFRNVPPSQEMRRGEIIFTKTFIFPLKVELESSNLQPSVWRPCCSPAKRPRWQGAEKPAQLAVFLGVSGPKAQGEGQAGSQCQSHSFLLFHNDFLWCAVWAPFPTFLSYSQLKRGYILCWKWVYFWSLNHLAY